MATDAEVTQVSFESLGESAQSALKQLYFIDCLEKKSKKKLDTFYEHQRKGIRVFNKESTDIIPDDEKRRIELRVKNLH